MERENIEWGMVLLLEGMLRQEHFLPHKNIEMQCLFEKRPVPETEVEAGPVA